MGSKARTCERFRLCCKIYIYVIANEKKKGDDLITYGNNVPIIGVRNYKMKSANGIEHEQEHSLDYAAPDNINYNR